MQMNGVYRWLDEGEDDGKTIRELKLKNRTSEELHKTALVRSADHFVTFNFNSICIQRCNEPRLYVRSTCFLEINIYNVFMLTFEDFHLSRGG